MQKKQGSDESEKQGSIILANYHITKDSSLWHTQNFLYQTESSVREDKQNNEQFKNSNVRANKENERTQGTLLIQPYYSSCPKAACEALQINREHKHIAQSVSALCNTIACVFQRGGQINDQNM